MLKTTLSALLCGLGALPLDALADEPVSQAVIVAGKKEAVVKKVDKTVYDVANTARAANGTAQDVLQATPGVSVTAAGQIAVKGNSQVTVLVDGKPAAMLAGDERTVALQTMSGSDIASVEVITSPSAAYAANGGAILNIVLKHDRKLGTRGRIQASAADHGLWNAGASGEMNQEKLSINGSVALRRDGNQKYRSSTVDWNNPVSGRIGETVQTSEVFVHRRVETGTLDINYALTDADNLNLSMRHNSRRSRPYFDVLNKVSVGSEETIFHRISLGPNEQSDNVASLSYNHQRQDSALKAMVQRSKTTTLIDKSYRDLFAESALVPGYSRGATRSGRRLNQATVDWSGTSDSGQWGIGLDIQEKVDDLFNYQALINPVSGAETPDPETTNAYGVKGIMSAAYVTNQIRYEDWKLLIGGRAERMVLRVSPAGGMTERAHWNAFNPSLNLKYAIDETAELTLGYRRSLQMPDSRDFNPFSTYVDAQNLSRGNPSLQPQLLATWEIGTDVEIGNLSSNVTGVYRTSRDTVTDARSFADDVLITSKQNGGRARSIGLTASLDWKSDAHLSLGLDGGVFNVVLQTPDLGSIVRQQDVSGYLNVRAKSAVGQDDLELDAHVQSSAITPLGRLGSNSSVNVTWKRKLSNTLNLTVNANDIFDGSKRTYRTDTSTFRLSGFDHFVGRRLVVGFIKKFE